MITPAGQRLIMVRIPPTMGPPLRSDSEGLGFSLRFYKLQGILAKANNILYVT
jgi:hypothetical protein